jgi:hypothetical protein
VAQAPIAAALLMLVSGIVQMNRSMLEAGAAVGAEAVDPVSRMTDAMGQILTLFVLGLPWIIAVVVIGISATKVHAWLQLRKAAQGAVDARS